MLSEQDKRNYCRFKKMAIHDGERIPVFSRREAVHLFEAGRPFEPQSLPFKAEQNTSKRTIRVDDRTSTKSFLVAINGTTTLLLCHRSERRGSCMQKIQSNMLNRLQSFSPS